MGFKGHPAPNAYSLPAAVGHRRHDPTKWRGPALTMAQGLPGPPAGLGPGLYGGLMQPVTRFGDARGPRVTMAAKLPNTVESVSPGPAYYHPDRFRTHKETPPKFTMARRTPVPDARYAPAANAYRLPSTLGPRVPHKPCNGAFTMGSKIPTPRGEGAPAPCRYGPFRPDVIRPSAPRHTMGRLARAPGDRTRKPAPNAYFPKQKNKPRAPGFSFAARDSDSRIVYFTREDGGQR